MPSGGRLAEEGVAVGVAQVNVYVRAAEADRAFTDKPGSAPRRDDLANWPHSFTYPLTRKTFSTRCHFQGGT